MLNKHIVIKYRPVYLSKKFEVLVKSLEEISEHPRQNILKESEEEPIVYTRDLCYQLIKLIWALENKQTTNINAYNTKRMFIGTTFQREWLTEPINIQNLEFTKPIPIRTFRNKTLGIYTTETIPSITNYDTYFHYIEKESYYLKFITRKLTKVECDIGYINIILSFTSLNKEDSIEYSDPLEESSSDYILPVLPTKVKTEIRKGLTVDDILDDDSDDYIYYYNHKTGQIRPFLK